MTRSEVRQWQIEAGAAGDQVMVETCERALAGDAAAWAEVERIDRDAREIAAQDEAVAR